MFTFIAKPPHHPCRAAECDLDALQHKVSVLREVLRAHGLAMMTATHIIPEVPTAPVLQWGYERTCERIAGVTCYIRFSKTDGGKEWLRHFLGVFRAARKEFRKLCEDVLALHMIFIQALLEDVRDTTFGTHFGPLLEAALAYSHADWCGEESAAYCQEVIKRRLARYREATAMERLIPDAASLSERALVQRVSALFRANLQRWDRLHGLKLQHTHRVLEAFAFELEDNYDRGVYSLCF